MRALALPFLHGLSNYAPLVLRVIIGVVMTAHGWQKLTELGPANFGGAMLQPNGIPAPTLAGWLVTGLELIGGILLVVGLATRLAAALLSLLLLGAIVLVKLEIGLIAPMGAMLPGAELDLALFAGLVTLVLLGPRRPSLDQRFGIERRASASQT